MTFVDDPELPDDWATVHPDDDPNIEPAPVFPLETGAQFLRERNYLDEDER